MNIEICLPRTPQNFSDAEKAETGTAAPIAASVRMKILYMARCCRFVLLFPVCALSREITKWTQACDRQYAQAHLDDRVPITLCQVDQATASSPNRTGLGLDFQKAKNWSLLPKEGKVTLWHILNQMETECRVPAQILHNLICLMGKPTGGDRDIALTPGLWRLYMRIRKCDIMQCMKKKL